MRGLQLLEMNSAQHGLWVSPGTEQGAAETVRARREGGVVKTQSDWPQEETRLAAGQSGPEAPWAQEGGCCGAGGGSSLVWSHQDGQKLRQSGCFWEVKSAGQGEGMFTETKWGRLGAFPDAPRGTARPTVKAELLTPQPHRLPGNPGLHFCSLIPNPRRCL